MEYDDVQVILNELEELKSRSLFYNNAKSHFSLLGPLVRSHPEMFQGMNSYNLDEESPKFIHKHLRVQGLEDEILSRIGKVRLQCGPLFENLDTSMQGTILQAKYKDQFHLLDEYFKVFNGLIHKGVYNGNFQQYNYSSDNPELTMKIRSAIQILYFSSNYLPFDVLSEVREKYKGISGTPAFEFTYAPKVLSPRSIETKQPFIDTFPTDEFKSNFSHVESEKFLNQFHYFQTFSKLAQAGGFSLQDGDVSKRYKIDDFEVHENTIFVITKEVGDREKVWKKNVFNLGQLVTMKELVLDPVHEELKRRLLNSARGQIFFDGKVINFSLNEGMNSDNLNVITDSETRIRVSMDRLEQMMSGFISIDGKNLPVQMSLDWNNVIKNYARIKGASEALIKTDTIKKH